MMLYLECLSGISGDMVVAALLDLGADREKMSRALESLGLADYSIKISRVNVQGIDACDFDVYLHHHHHHDHEEGHHHHHEHRGLADILPLIDRGALSPTAKELATRIFRIVAEAEAEAHGVPIEEVHFHEVGAVDSIVDIVAAAVCMDDLAPDGVVISTLREGCGHVMCQHGLLPVPVPATANIIRAHALPVTFTDEPGEKITPTGAAIAAALRTQAALPERFTINRVGIGAGKRSFKAPNVLRAMLITPEMAAESIWVVETNLDDCTGEQIGHAVDALMAAGARDASAAPLMMKKGRPGWLLKVLCDDARLSDIEALLFRETTAIGLRRYRVERTVLAREIREVTLPGGFIAKAKVTPGRIKPEADSVRALALLENIGWEAAEAQILAACKEF